MSLKKVVNKAASAAKKATSSHGTHHPHKTTTPVRTKKSPDSKAASAVAKGLKKL